jgi:hypothetical protein
MVLTSGMRATATTAAAVLLGGLGLTLHGVSDGHHQCSLAGVVLCMVALTVIVLTVIHHWITDTRAECAALASAERAAQTERLRYVAARAALQSEQSRLYRDLAAERAADAERLEVERAAMQEQFELARSQVAAEAMQTLASWVVNGKVRPPEARTGNLIRFPQQQPTPAPQPQTERSREHGAARP